MKMAYWLRPGIKVKRYIIIGLIGIFGISGGIAGFVSSILKSNLQYILSSFLILAGIVLLVFSIKFTIDSLMSILPRSGSLNVRLNNKELGKLMHEKRILVKGPKIVTIGGGTGLSNLLRGVKEFSSNITAVVTVADDGGGSGVLRNEMRILPPGDIRNCILSLANTEPLMYDLLQYRFEEGSLKGQSFGNLFLAALSGISDNFEEAVRKMGKVLAIVGKVLPVSASDITINAELEDGTIIEGESNIGDKPRGNKSRIKRVFMQDPEVEPLAEVIQAIEEADVIVFAPGSLYTSTIPVLIVPGVSEAIMRSDGIKIYACNVMTQPNETEDYTVSEHVKAIEDHSYKGIIQYCLADNTMLSGEIIERYKRQDSQPVVIDEQNISSKTRLLKGEFISLEDDLVRHDAKKIALAIIELVMDKILVKDKKRAIDYYYVKERLKVE